MMINILEEMKTMGENRVLWDKDEKSDNAESWSEWNNKPMGTFPKHGKEKKVWKGVIRES